jgi:hypothetical protein
MPEQIPLYHDSINDALGTCILALGGWKEVAGMLWPVLSREKPQTAYTRLKHCVNDGKDEKLSPDELSFIGEKARAVGCYALQDYLALRWQCEFKPLAPGEAKKRAKKALRKSLLDQLARLDDDE